MMKGIVGLALMVSLALARGPALAADTVLGRWCDRPLIGFIATHAVMTIRVNGSGSPELHNVYGDGSEGVRELVQVGEGQYKAVESSTDAGYVINKAGDLELWDNLGFIRFARRLNGAPTSGECGF